MYNFDENPELNITPLVDIMLVLLAILMVAQTAIIYDEKIELPSGSKAQVSENTAEFLLVRIGEDRKVYIDKSSMSLALDACGSEIGREVLAIGRACGRPGGRVVT